MKKAGHIQRTAISNVKKTEGTTSLHFSLLINSPKRKRSPPIRRTMSPRNSTKLWLLPHRWDSSPLRIKIE
ncbi:MAG: hypothetical protein DRQ04_05610 [Candidatus Hydrothermota bacterium]|nr:MAG: hypothetical protein DRQ04_05610 [Candidatus Hydrothermae bacterium]